MIRITDPNIQPFETAHIDAVRAAAPGGVVLLKNEGVLPLSEPGKLALYGSGARRTIKGGTGSGDVNVRHFVTIEEGLVIAGFEITSGAWLDGYEEIMNAAHAAWIQAIRDEAKDLASYSEADAAWIVEAGDYLVRVGSSAADTQAAGIVRVDADAVVFQAKNAFAGCTFADLKPKAAAAAQVIVPDIPVVEINGAALAAAESKDAFAAGCRDTSAENVRAAAAGGENASAAERCEDNSAKNIRAAAAAGCGERVSWAAVKTGDRTIDEFLDGLRRTS